MSQRHDGEIIIAMLDLKLRAKGPACEPIGLWLVDRAKRMWPRFAGLNGMRKTNVRYRYTIVSYHHPAQLCWEWSWSLSFNRRDTGWRSPFKWYRPFRYGSASLTIPFLFDITYSRQNYDYMLSRCAEQKLREYALEEPRP